ncbi:MAG: hypothetical protein LIP16_17460 [Clostridium sp.]|nr:hypothetical protein [Clostridium sp.]
MKEDKRNKRMAASTFLIALLGILLVLTGFTAARYIMENRKRNLLEAQNFYFTSNFLEEESENASYFIDPLAGEFSVELYNFADSLRKTPVSIEYKVTVESGQSSAARGTIGSDEGGGTAVIQIIPDRDSTDAAGNLKPVTVVAESGKPYKKVLKAVFIRELGNQFTVEDAPGYRAATLTMLCADSKKDITITLPDGVIPSATDDRVEYSGNICTFHSPGEGVYSLILLKSDSGSVLEGKENGKFANSIVIESGSSG